MRRFVIPAVIVPLLAACVSTTPGDPCAGANRDVDLFVLLDNTVSGNYDACLDELRDELDRARLRARVLEGEAARLEAEAAQLEGERAEAARRLAELNSRQAETLRRLEGAREAHAVDEAALRDVLQREQELASELESHNIEGGIDSTRSRSLEQEQDELLQRIEALLGEG